MVPIDIPLKSSPAWVPMSRPRFLYTEGSETPMTWAIDISFPETETFTTRICSFPPCLCVFPKICCNAS